MSYSILYIRNYKIRVIQKAILVGLLSVIISKTSGQTNYQPGYIITNENDTVNGLIDYRGDIRNSKKCSFKINENSSNIEYKPFEIKGFRFIDSKFYVSKSIIIENSQDSIFAEYLVNGIADLYYYRNMDQDHYFIEKNNGETYELSNEKKYGYDKGTRYVRNSQEYIGLLKIAFSDCIELYPQVDKTEFDHKSLINVTKNYHDYVCKDQKCIIYEKQLPVIKIRFAPVINLNISNIRIGDDSFYSSFDFEKSVSLSLGGIINASMPRLNEKLSSQLEVSIGKDYFYSFFIQDHSIYRKDYYDFHIRTIYLKGSGALKYTYPKGKIRPVASLGGSMYYSINSKNKIILEQKSISYINTYEYNDITIPDILFGGFGQIGVNYYLNENKIMFFTITYDYNYGTNLETNIVMKTLGFKIGIFL
jgi:hypothetical protein